ncbi:hypothetical protein VN12_20585 [Pirellula sp. SH-Sr6A]|uniref:hypothetical protein n=1 Tax=Pirellula sp. SH-Sr6A TaxID=1632865 RepID=UPI00078EA8E8|nr:hypothetical protein [Pirellula sp. SH-Sr6A]AMV34535.1 hypothetical protein VN12_20585 [Pirellula sp. SH-Sr6A]
MCSQISLVQRLRRVLLLGCLAMPAGLAMGSISMADDYETVVDPESGISTRKRSLVLHPMAETVPALRIRLLPEAFHAKPGNAATYYLKATGFFEQNAARDELSRLQKEAAIKAKEQGKELADVAPYSYLEMDPSELPVEEVRKYLELFSFQPFLLEEARMRSVFEMDRNIKESDNPIGYLIPEIQVMRDLASTQSIRCRLAIAEGKTDDAIRVLSQQFALARHLGQDDFIISGVVGIAIASIAQSDALHVVQRADCPNLYWAIATMPDPLVSFGKSISIEANFIEMQFKSWRSITEEPKPDSFWEGVIQQFATYTEDFPVETPEDRGLDVSETSFGSLSRDEREGAIRKAIESEHTAARVYLVDACGMTKEQVERYGNAQAIFLAMKLHYERMRDEYFKWLYAPTPDCLKNLEQVEARMGDQKKHPLGRWTRMPCSLLPSLIGIQKASIRLQQNLAIIKALEGIRMYGAFHQGQLPSDLGQLPVPVSVDPATMSPLQYKLEGSSARLMTVPVNGVRSELSIRFAK